MNSAQEGILTEIAQRADGLLGRFAQAAAIIAPPLLRVGLAVPFFKSGLTKWDGFLSLSPAAVFLWPFPAPPRKFPAIHESKKFFESVVYCIPIRKIRYPGSLPG